MNVSGNESSTRRVRRFSFPSRLAVLALAAALLLPPASLAAEKASSGKYANGRPKVEGVDEHLGKFIPLDAQFTDSQGNKVTMGQIMKKPTVLAFFYTRCAGICPRLLTGIATVMNRMPLQAGKDYQVVCVSFDATDTPAKAAAKKHDYMHLLQKNVPAKDWLFLTGNQDNIDKMTQACGFSVQKAGNMFVHPTTLIVLSPKGKIVQYLYGVSYVPSALELAISDAAKGKVGSKIINTLLPCFSTQAKGTHIVAIVMAGTGIAILLIAAAFIAWLVFTDPKRRKKRKEMRS